MGELSERERNFLARLDRTQRVATWFGIAFALLGALYIAWAVAIFDYRSDPRTQPAFDAPVARLGFLYDRYQRVIGKIVPETQVERWLLDGMKRGMFFSAGVMVLMLRIYLGTLVLLMGLAALTVVIERRRLLSVIATLRE